MEDKYDRLQAIREISGVLKTKIDDLVAFQMGTKPIDKDVYGENFDPFDLSHLQSAIKDYSDSEAQKDKMIDSIVRSSQRQKSQLFKVIESISLQKMNEDSERFGQMKRRAERKVKVKQEIRQRMSVIRGSMMQESMISGIDGMQSFDYDEVAMNSTIK